MRGAITEGEEVMRNPMRGILVGCCASTLTTHTVSATTIAKSASHFGYFDIAQYRFWIADFRLSETDFERNPFIGLFSWRSIQNLKSKIT